MTFANVTNIHAASRSLKALWSPKVLAQVNDQYVKVARVHGEFPWHAHADEDELFLVLSGALTIDYEDHSVELGPGDLHVVPKGVRHHPRAAQPCGILLIETITTAHTGDVVTEQTRSIEEQLRS